jgi:hypothetical protein
MTAAERVARGAAMLDGTAPGWESRIDPASLDLADPCRCVLRQVFPRRPFGDSVAALGLMSRLVEHGLAPDAGERDEYGLTTTAASWWDELADAWVAEVRDRMKGPLS